MHVLVEPAVIPQATATVGDLVVAGEDGAAVAHAGQVLRRIEREDGDAAEAADPAAIPLGSLCLRAIFEDPEAQARGEALDGRQIHGLTIEMDGHDPDRPRCGFRLGVGHVERVELVRVDEDRRRLSEADRLDGRERGVRRHQDLVAGLHAERPEREPERGGGRAGQHGVPHAGRARQLDLQLTALGAQDVLTRVDGGQHCPLDLVVDRRARQRDERHGVGPDRRS